MATVSPASILRRTSAFLDEALSQPDLRRAVLASARRRLTSPDPTTLQALALLSQVTESSSSSSSSSAAAAASRPSPASLRTAEKLLLTLPSKNPLSSLLLAFVHALRRRPREAALSLLDLFALAPSAARYEVAAPVFEDLFIPHLLPAIQWFADQRSRILASQPSSGLDDDGGQSIEVTAAISLLSRMSGGQAEELKELERGYEDVLDENTRAYSGFLKEVLESPSDEWEALLPPQLVLTRVKRNRGVFEAVEEEDGDEEDDDEGQGIGSRPKLGSRNGRYNPMWSEEEERSDEFLSRQSSRIQDKNAKFSSKYPQRVSPQRIVRQPSTNIQNPNAYMFSDIGPGFSSDENSLDSDAEFDPGIQEKNTRKTSFGIAGNQLQDQEQTSSETTCSSNHQMVDADSILASSKHTPPKDFVCPITSNIFDDPVTLETGQTYERKAIQEWLDRGNSTCPITRQTLHSTQLPKTNYVLKRLIASWREQHNAYSTPARSENPSPKDVPDFNPLKRAPSPTSVISQASFDGATGDLRQVISRLCTSEILSESEMAVLQIEQLWREAGPEPEILPVLSKPAVVNGFVEILLNSVNANILRSAVFMLTELAFRDNFVIQTLTRVDSDVDCLVSLFKEGLAEAVVLIYMLSRPPESLIEMDMLDALMMAINRKEDENFEMCLKPRTASLFILTQMVRVENQKNVSEFMGSLIPQSIVEGVIPSLESDLIEERSAAVEILLRCMEEDGNCRKDIADTAEFGPLLESFSLVNDTQRFQIVHFLNELVKLSRRTFNEQILHIIKDGGAYSTMHVLLVYLQTVLHDQSPIVASLLLQLDVLMEPRKMSIYREEAVDALISCLRNTDFPNSQMLAAETIMAFQGRFSSAGKSLAKAYLLKKAGMNKSYRAIMQAEQMGHTLGNSEENLEEEEKAAGEWERRIAFALVSHEFGLIFEALAEGMKSRRSELFSTCLVSATWLTHMLSTLPDMGIQGAARVCLLKLFVSILKSARDVDDKALAMLALRSFMYDPEGLHDMTSYVKEILRNLRELKKFSSLAYEMLKLFSDGQESSVEMWNHKELVQVDCSMHGEVLSIICFKNRIITGHSDGTIKVWSGIDSLLNPIQEAREHSKAVTSLAVSGDKIYSGSTDKTMRVWAHRNGEIHCLEIHDMKDQVHSLVVANTISCFIPQGAGVKVILLNGGSKVLNQNRNVKSLALVQGKLYCGCQDSSIQEIDLATGTVATIQAGNRRLLGKSNPVHTMRVHDGFLYTAGTSIEGAAVKVWNASNHNLVGSFPTAMDVRSIVTSTELIYIGGKMGNVEIWSRDKLNKVSTLQTGTSGKVQCMAIDSDGELLVVGTSDGKIQAWGLT